MIAGVEVRECPRQVIGNGVRTVTRICEAAFYAERGLLPCAGGVGDQAAAAMEGIRCVWEVDAVIDKMKREGERL